MAGWFSRAWAQAVELWQRLSGPAKALGIGLVLALVVTGGLASRTPAVEYAQLPGQPFSGQDLKAVTAQLDELKVPYKQGGDGTILLVPKDQELKARLALTQTPAGLEIFDSPRWTASDTDKQVLFLRAMEGELSRALTGMAQIERATVKLAIPKETVFVRQQKPVTAGVMIQTRAGRELTARQVDGIVRFVAMSVPGLDANHVVIIDDSGRTLTKAPKSPDMVDSQAASDLIQLEMTYRQEYESKLRAALEQFLGPGNVAVTVNVELDHTSSTVTETSHGPPVVIRTARNEETGATAGTPPQPAAGVAANTPGPPVYAGQNAGATQSEKVSTQTEYAPPVVTGTTTKTTPPGRVVRKTASVLVNKEMVSPETVDQIKAAAANTIGVAPELVAVAALPWNNQLVKALAEPAAPLAGGGSVTLPPGLVGGLAAAALLAVLLAWRRGRQTAELAMAGEADFAVELAAELPEELRTESLAMAESEQDEAAAGQEVPLVSLLGEDVVQQLAEEKERRKIREEVQRLVMSNPAAAAMLVKIWINEER